MSLFAELKRRNVIRMAGLYLVGAWLIVQVAGTVIPMFGAPELVVLLALGFVPREDHAEFLNGMGRNEDSVSRDPRRARQARAERAVRDQAAQSCSVSTRRSRRVSNLFARARALQGHPVLVSWPMSGG